MNDPIVHWSPGMSLEMVERLVIMKAFGFFKNNKTATAISLGIAIRTLDSKLERYEQEEKIEKERQENELLKRTDFLARQRGNPPNNLGIPYSPSPAIHGALSGPRMESFANSAPQQSMPVQERQEVQKVLSTHITPSGKPKAR